jgi:hypothetical protein
MTTIKVMNTATGWKLASSVRGVSTGERGARVICDDLHSVTEAESERVRTETVRWFREPISSRFNDLDTGARVMIAQRVHQSDVYGIVLGPEFDYCHLMIPWEYDPSRQCDVDGNPIPNEIGWVDPRTKDGEPAWPERFSPAAIERIKRELGSFGFASQFQQSPVPRGGGYVKRDYWNVWESKENRFPPFEYIVGSLDCAFTEKETNDPSAFTLWGVFSDASTSGGYFDGATGQLWHAEGERQRKICLIKAWRKHLAFSAPRVPMRPGEYYGVYRQRTMNEWGLMEHVFDSCTSFNDKPLCLNRLLIEAKANGISVAQEMRNRYGPQNFVIETVPVRGTKLLACWKFCRRSRMVLCTPRGDRTVGNSIGQRWSLMN